MTNALCPGKEWNQQNLGKTSTKFNNYPTQFIRTSEVTEIIYKKYHH